MTRVDFAHGASNRFHTACQVIQRHYLAGNQVVVYASDTRRLTHLDRLLWAFEPTAFIPHVMQDDELAPTTPVVLTSISPTHHRTTSQGTQRWLLNLDMACPPDAAQFARILEIVSHHDDDKTAARQRWASYRKAGFELRAHQLHAAQTSSELS